jgi:hypothetical protein
MILVAVVQRWCTSCSKVFQLVNVIEVGQHDFASSKLWHLYIDASVTLQ